MLCYKPSNLLNTESKKVTMDKTTIEIPTELLEAVNITADDAKKELAIRLYQMHKLNDRQAGELAGDPEIIESMVWGGGESGQFDLNNFLDWASHDLKTPLNSVIGFTKIVLKGFDGPINETQETDLTAAFTAGERTLALISYLVEIARLNNGKMKLMRADNDITEIITDATTRWKKKNPSTPLNIDVEINNPTFNVDAEQMLLIISYLLTFAALRVTEGTVTLSTSDSDNALNFRIHSNGKKVVDKSEMDSAMITFITSSLIKLHGGQMDDPQETDDGLLLRFSIPR
jgi:K+-sensing histidine kinase KdpD